MLFKRLYAIPSELQCHLRLWLLRRRERRALAFLGAAAASSPGSSAAPATLMARISDANRRLDRLRAEAAASLEADRADYAAVSSWARPVVILRGFCARAILRNQIAAVRRDIEGLHEELGKLVTQSHPGGAGVPAQLTTTVQQVRSDLDAVLAGRARLERLVLPSWVPHLRAEANRLGHALWLQLRPNVLPRLPALVGLVVGWWIADTYTTSHFKSLLHSVGIGNGGRRVVSGDTYRAMLFWLPILAAGVCAYLADRIKFLVQRRYLAPAPDRAPGS